MDYKVAKLGYLAFGVPNVDDAVDFYRRAIRLTVSERRDGAVFLTGDRNHHWIRLQENAPIGALRMGYQMVDDAALEDVKASLTDRGIQYKEGSATMAEDRIDNSIRFTDPGGVEVELYTEMAELSVDPVSTGVKLEKFLHAVWAEPNIVRAHDFYANVLGFRTSDWLERGFVFMHCADRYHHGIAIANAHQDAWSFNHFCVLVDSIDDVMRYRHNAARLGVTIRNDVLRHGPSGSTSVYLLDPFLGHAVEYCTGHPQVDDATYRARTLPTLEWSIDIWKMPLPEVPAESAAVPRAVRT
jgi:2,3-dihydroxy-p-cumate/2,3-dihydroxybenzoate 3,4-dioxygenase